MQLKRQEVYLPFFVTLNNFKKIQDFGTGRDGSYETRVSLRTVDESTDHTITLNNPAKKSIFTIYQDSYRELEIPGKYMSILKINIDPGRYLKYFGWALALLGMFVHFSLRSIVL